MRDFAIVFDVEAEGNEEAIVTEDFAERWGWYGVMHRLCNEDLSKLSSITELQLLECLTWLSYETDLNESKNVQINDRKQNI